MPSSFSRRWQSGVVAIDEEEIAPALAALGRPGPFIEPTAATAGEALTRVLRDGSIAADQSTVVVLTGSGLKAADRIGELLGVGARQRVCRRSRSVSGMRT